MQKNKNVQHRGEAKRTLRILVKQDLRQRRQQPRLEFQIFVAKNSIGFYIQMRDPSQVDMMKVSGLVRFTIRR